jgi:hypothetical protein
VAQDGPVDDPSIFNHEWCLRRVHHSFVKPSGEPDSSVFKDDRLGIGTSITLVRGPADLQIVISGYDGSGVVAVQIEAFRKEGLGVAFTYEAGNPNHCEVFGQRGGGVLKRLRAQARWVVYPPDYPEALKTELFEPPLPT